MSAMMTDATIKAPAKRTRLLTAPGRMIGVSLFLGWLFEWAFYDKPLGVSLLLYVGALVSAAHGVSLFEGVRSQKRNLLLLLPLGFFASMVFVRSNEWLTFLNVCAVMGLLMLWVYFFSAENIYTQSLPSFLTRPIFVMGYALAGGFSVAAEATAAVRDNENRTLPKLLPVLRGLLLALPILIVFGGLLLSADMLFAQRVETFFAIEDFGELVTRVMVSLFVAWLVVGVMAYAMTRGQQVLSAEQADKVGISAETAPPRRLLSLGMTETSVVLTTVNLLFGAFVAFQFVYLFGGVRNINLEGFTYAEYARQGFWEMTAVAVLTLLLVLTLKAFSRREPGRQTMLFNGLSTLMVAFVTIMLISAYQRLTLLEVTYGYTFLRLQSHIFMLWLGATLVWFVLSLWIKPERFAIGFALCAFGFLAHLNLINPDRAIVEHNWQRYQLIGGDVVFDYRQVYAREGLDLMYLASLSHDAIPALLEIQDQLSAERPYVEVWQRSDSGSGGSYETEIHQFSARTWLANELKNERRRIAKRVIESPWQSWHYGEALNLGLLQDKFGYVSFSD